MCVAVSDLKDAHALKDLRAISPLPLVADIHFRYVSSPESVDCIDNPGNIGSKDKIKAVDRCAMCVFSLSA